MRIVVDINHPAHIHYFKHFIWEMQKRGHEFLITASKKDISYRLLDAYGFDYVRLGNYGESLIEKAINLLLLDLKMYNAIKDFKPDVCIGSGSIRAAHVAFLLKSKSILLESTDHSNEQHMLYLPFVSTILTPTCFLKKMGEKQIYFNGYKELMYLHPNYFTPNPTVLSEIGLKEGDPYIIVRFVSWQASHDIGQHGVCDKVGLVKELEQYGRVMITSEGALPSELQPYQVRVSPENLHDLLYYATLYVGEGATIASECAIIGTHAIYINSLELGYIKEEDEKYQLVSNFSGKDCTDEMVFAEAKRLLQNPNLRKEGKEKGKTLVRDKIDVTAFMVWFIEQFPESVDLMKSHPEIQQQFGYQSHYMEEPCRTYYQRSEIKVQK